MTFHYAFHVSKNNHLNSSFSIQLFFCWRKEEFTVRILRISFARFFFLLPERGQKGHKKIHELLKKLVISTFYDSS